MSVIHYEKQLRLPSPHRSFERNVSYIVGYYVGTSFRIKRWFDNYDAAILSCASCQDRDDDVQWFVFEIRTEIFLVQ